MVHQVNNEIRPRVAFLEVTSKCLLECKHCINYKYDGKDLCLDDIHFILKKLREGGVKLIKFTGGEPFDRDDFKQIVLQCEDMGLKYIIYSNGMNLGFDWLNSLSNLDSIRISFDGYKQTHDYIRGKGNFDIVFQNLINSVKIYPNIKFVVNYTVNTQNYNQIEDFDRLISEYGLDVSINIGFVKYAGRAMEQDELLFSKEEAESVYLIIQQELMKCSHIDRFSMLSEFYLENHLNTFGCPAAKETIFIARNGDVYPCGMFKGNKKFYCGNLTCESLDSILSSDIIRYMKSLTLIPDRCTQCNAYQKICTGGCRGNAYNTLNGLCGLDPNCIFYNIIKAV